MEFKLKFKQHGLKKGFKEVVTSLHNSNSVFVYHPPVRPVLWRRKRPRPFNDGGWHEGYRIVHRLCEGTDSVGTLKKDGRNWPHPHQFLLPPLQLPQKVPVLRRLGLNFEAFTALLEDDNSGRRIKRISST